MPTDEPTESPTREPTSDPTSSPTADTASPTLSPSFEPTFEPTSLPTTDPTLEPTPATRTPTTDPTTPPTKKPTPAPFDSGSIPTPVPTPDVVAGDAGTLTDTQQGESGLLSSNNLVIAAVFAGLFVCTLAMFVAFCCVNRKRNQALKGDAARMISMSQMPAQVVHATSPSSAVEGETATGTYPKGMRSTNGAHGAEDDVNLPEEDEDGDFDDMVAPTKGQGQEDGFVLAELVCGVDGDSDEVEAYDGMYTVPKRKTVAGDELKMCDECQQSVAVALGREDEQDGNWYCNGCWNAFYETNQ